VDWRIWGPVLAGLGTLREVRDEWSLRDLLDAHEALAGRSEAECLATERVRKKTRDR